MSFGFIGLRKWLLLSLVGAAAAWAQTEKAPVYYFTTLAGTSSSGVDDGAGSAARFYFPSRVAMDRAGNAFVADGRNFVIRKVTPAGVVSTVAGSAGLAGSADGQGAAARFGGRIGTAEPIQGLAIDSGGNLFVADGGNYTIRKVTPDGTVTTFAGTAGAAGSADGTGNAARFSSLRGLTIDASGNLFALDNQYIRKINPAGVVSTVTGVGGMPTDIVVDALGNFYLTDYASVIKVAPNGASTVLAGTNTSNGAGAGYADGTGDAAKFSAPGGIAIDGAGNLFVADTWNCAIRRVTPAGVVTTVAGGAGVIGSEDGVGSAAHFLIPAGLAVDATGNVIVTDTGNNTVRKITPQGTVTTLAGLPNDKSFGSVDGVGAAARFNNPYGIAVDVTGVCYVADSTNHVIRKVSASGAVTTLAGKAGETGLVDGTGADARFLGPLQLALDASGNIYVTDDYVVRKITPAGVVTTLAGNPERRGPPVDGQGSAAVFLGLTGIAVAPDGTIWVAEPSGSSMYSFWARVRKITPAGLVTTQSTLQSVVQPHTYWTGLTFDSTGTLYACDKTYFNLAIASVGGEKVLRLDNSFSPLLAATRSPGQVFVTDSGELGQSRVGWLSGSGQFQVIGGAIYSNGHKDGIGTDARFDEITGIAIDAQGSLYLACGDNTIRKGVLATSPTIVTQPQSQSVAVGASAQFSVSASGVPAPTYQWSLGGTAIAGATSATYSLAAVKASDAGDYTVTVTNEIGNVSSAKATLTVSASSGGGSGGGSGGSGSGGGGAPSAWFFAAMTALVGARVWRDRFTVASRE